jgi:hypothetical protein
MIIIFCMIIVVPEYSSLFLAMAAVIAGSLPLDFMLYRLAAHGTGFAGTTIDGKLLFEVSGLTIGTGKVTQAGATLLDGCTQDFFYRPGQLLVSLETDSAGSTVGVNPRVEQRLTGIDVSHADHHLAVHDELFNGNLAMA